MHPATLRYYHDINTSAAAKTISLYCAENKFESAAATGDAVEVIAV